MTDPLQEIEPLENLPEMTGRLARSIREVSDRLIDTAVNRSEGIAAWSPNTPVLRHVTFNWQFRLARRHEKVVFFFIRRAAIEQLLIDARISLNLAPVPRSDGPAGLPAARPGYRFVVPPFVVAAPSASAVARRTDRLLLPGSQRATPRNTVLVGLGDDGEDALAIVNPERSMDFNAARAKLQFNPARGESYEVRRSGDARFPALLLIEAVRDWVAADPWLGVEVPFELSTRPDRTDVSRILEKIVLAQARAIEEGGSPGGAMRAGDPLAALFHDYTVFSYEAKVALRLRADGNLAAVDEDDPFQLDMHVAVRSGDDGPTARVAVGIPDFLVRGDFRDRLFTALESAEVAGILLDKLQRTAHAQAMASTGRGLDRAALLGFLRRAKAGSIVFRTARSARKNNVPYDTDVFVLYGPLGDDNCLLIVKGRFRVVEVEDRTEPDGLHKGWLKIVHFGVASRERGGLTKDTADYLLKLLTIVFRWKGILR